MADAGPFPIIGMEEMLFKPDGSEVGIAFIDSNRDHVMVTMSREMLQKITAQFERTARHMDAAASGNQAGDVLFCQVQTESVDVSVIKNVPGVSMILRVSPTLRYVVPLDPRSAQELAENLVKFSSGNVQFPDQGRPS